MSNSQMSFNNWIIISILSITGIISLMTFVYIENKAVSPLIDFKLILNKVLLSANFLRMISGLFMFTILNTIPILIRNPKPLGFGESALNTAYIIIPFMSAYLIIGLSSGIILSKLGNIKVILIGSIICTIGFIDTCTVFSLFNISFNWPCYFGYRVSDASSRCN